MQPTAKEREESAAREKEERAAKEKVEKLEREAVAKRRTEEEATTQFRELTIHTTVLSVTPTTVQAQRKKLVPWPWWPWFQLRHHRSP